MIRPASPWRGIGRMIDGEALRAIFSVENAAWTATLLLMLFLVRMWNGAPAVFAQWIEWRRSIAEAQAAERKQTAEDKAADWGRLREEISRLTEAEQKCRESFDQLHDNFLNLRQELADLRGYLAGQGRASQEAAGIVAIERLARNPPQKD